MRKPLPSQAFLRERFSYEDGFLVYRCKAGTRAKPGDRLGSVAKSPRSNYLAASVLGERYYVHRLIWKWHYGTEPEFLDHVNRVRTDNRVENLRESSHRENAWNTEATIKSGLPPCLSTYDGPGYMVRVSVDGRVHYVGVRRTVEEAVALRDKALANYAEYSPD